MNNILSSVATITNASQAPQLSNPVAERVDIHKSCKSLETLLNVLNDYCEAATAIVTLQRKLAKALRDTASSKITNETAGNALNASANIFEALAEVDGKFVKIADREYDAISTEVKRWFKKLAKEEKAHDERITNANARIKQAGANFEKKSRKKSLDTQDEHSRYIHLVSTLGPEITQEKYNHLLQTTQRQTITIYSVAACLSRIADTEWVRSCECVRRFAPTVGPLGEWRSLCEGGWMRNIPGDLINLEAKSQDNLKLNTIKERIEPEAEEGTEEKNRAQQSIQPVQERQTYEHTSPLRHLRSDGEVPTSDPQGSHPLPQPNLPRGERELTTSTSASYPSQSQSSSSGNSPILLRYQQSSNYDGTTSHPPPSTIHLLPPPPSAPSPGQVSISPANSASASPRVPTQVHSSDPDPIHDNLQPPSPTSRYSQPRSRDESPTSDDHGRFFSDPATGSVRSLSAFPTPPNHFPLPPPRPKGTPTYTSARPSVSAIKESQEEQTHIAQERLSESPLPLEYAEDVNNNNLPPPPQQRQPRRPSGGSDRHQESDTYNVALGVSSDKTSPQVPTIVPRLHGLQYESSGKNSASIPERGEFQARDFGVLREERGTSATTRARTFSGGVPTPPEVQLEFPSASIPLQKRNHAIERTDTGTTAAGNIVAAMKSRYSSAGSRSPPPRLDDLPRLQMSVTEIANRYRQPPPTQDIPATQNITHTPNASITDAGDVQEQLPRIKQPLLQPLAKSPPPPIGRHTSNPSLPEKIEPRQYVPSTATTSPRLLLNAGISGIGMKDSLDGYEDRMQWHQVEARERELRDREQEIILRERELERDRVRLLALRDGLASTSQSANSSEHGGQNPRDTRDSTSPQSSGQQLQPRPRRISFRRSRQDSQPQTPQLKQEQLRSPTGDLSLNPSISSPNLRERPQTNHSYSSPSPSSPSANQDYNPSHLSKSTGSPPLQQGQQPQEKKGGWMRRLSMPVGSALPFSLDSSKRNVNNSSSSTSSNQNASVRPLGAGIVGGKGVDEKRNSVAAVLGIGARESRDGGREYGYGQQHQQQPQGSEGGRLGNAEHGLGRKNYDATRSASNLNLGRTKY